MIIVDADVDPFDLNQVVWALYYCNVCEFNWRDSEPKATIDPDLRPNAFQVDPTRLEDFEILLPPPKN